jgi:hypothetical protein
MTAYVITAGYVTVTTAVDGGRARVDITRGAALPDDVPAAEVSALLAYGHIEPVVEAEPEPSVRKTRKTGS